jgi:hypothetical protein
MTDKTTPAFPIADPFIAMKPQTEKEAKLLQAGMTLRDYFAAKAMQGLITSLPSDSTLYDSNVAKWAYEMADAMLEERK